MQNERWHSPFAHTIPFILFRRHFTELNDVYWAHVPAASTIEKKAYDALGAEDADPKKYFLIPDKDDRRMAPTYAQWKSLYREFSNYTRLNMLMLLSSCFETYLRTIVSLSFESKPGIIIRCPNAVDGAFLLKENRLYGEYGSKEYQFSNEVDAICCGEWSARIATYINYFGSSPLTDTEVIELDDLRQKRNLVGHYFGREKKKYETPLYVEPSPVHRLSHEKLIKYFNVVYTAAEKIDSHLQEGFIGSYDIIKYYYQFCEQNSFHEKTAGTQTKELQKMLGALDFPNVTNTYYRNIISYFLLDDVNESCRYSKNACITEVNLRLRDLGISLENDGKKLRFSKYHFQLFSKAFSFQNNPEFCKGRILNGTPEYFYSAKAIDIIVTEVVANPATIISILQNRISKE